ncbi:MAG: tetratricopeptide repeat protein [Deltaproteobacteria bacterium]|nr:tetratricopeptide repeat protein [Deltaproteobacteria bacterium]
MTASILSSLRTTSLAWALVCTGMAVLLPPVVGVQVAAARPKKAKGKAKKGKDRDKDKDDKIDIEKRDLSGQEGNLQPKKDYTLDETILKTKDLKPAIEDSKRPGLSPAELKRFEAEAFLDAKLDEQIGLANQLVELQPDCAEGAPVRFRLADLYWEKSKRAFFKSEDGNVAEGDRAKWGAQMKKLQNVAIANYKKIADDCPGFPDFPKVLFFLGSSLSEIDKAQEGANYFQRIIKEFPQSEWVGNAWFMVGEYFFNTTTGNVNENAAKALRAYKRAEEYKDSTIYGYAIYKQGWCYINTTDWDLALERFQRVVTVSEDQRQKLDQKGRVSLRREALKDYVRAYSNVGDAKQAFKAFMKIGGKESVAWMMESLGNWYINKDAHTDTIATYRELIKNYSRSTRTPLWQGRIVDAVAKLEKKNVVPESKKLTEYFETVRERVQKGDLEEEEKKTVNKDLAEAEEIAENTLRKLAMDFHTEAKKLRGTAADRTFRLAHDLYKHYLTVFPKPKEGAEVNYVFYMRFYYAEVLYKLETFKDAADNYDMVVDMNPHPTNPKEKDIVQAAAEESVRSYKELIEDMDRKSPPEVSGTEPKAIPEIKMKFIHACDRYISYVGAEGEKIVPIRFMKARIFYVYNHFDQAAPSFNDIVANHPAADEACLAANLTLDIYNGLKSYASLRDAAHSYVGNKQLACADDDRAKFAKIEEQSAFKFIKVELEEKKKWMAAAKEYRDYYTRFPTGEFADDAIYNTAYCYDQAGRLDDAISMREFLVNKMPTADAALKQETNYNIAASYERVVDFDKAAKYLEIYAQKYPKDDKSKDALYNAGLYRAQLRQFDEARRLRDQFIKLYPADPDTHKVAFANCQSIEDEAGLLEKRAQEEKKQAELGKVILKKWEDANDCLGKYVGNKVYGNKDADLVCHAQFRRGEIMRVKTNYAKGYWDQHQLLVKAWPRWKAEGLEKVPKCATAMAEIDFRGLVDDFKKYKDMTITEINPADEKKMKTFNASRDSKVKTRDQLIEKYKGVVEYGVAEWALAALFDIGEAYMDSVDKLLNAPIPDKIQGVKVPDEIKQQIKDDLKKQTQPIVESAIEAYRICVNKANELGVYNKWSMKALQELQKLRPEEFPPVYERTTQAQFVDALTVQANSVVIPDGDSWRPVSAPIELAGAKEVSAEQKAKAGVSKPVAAPPIPGEDKGKKGGKKGKKGKAGKGDN